MSEKTAIETAREALKEIANHEVGTWDKPVPFSVLYRRSVDIAREALAALDAEKPGEDAKGAPADSKEAATLVFNCIKIEDDGHRKYPVPDVKWAAQIIQSYAETNATKRLAAERLRTLEEIQEVKRLGNLASIGIVIDRLIADAKKAVEP